MLAWIRPRVSDMLLCSDACPYHHLKLIGGGASGSGSAADLSSTAYSAYNGPKQKGIFCAQS